MRVNYIGLLDQASHALRIGMRETLHAEMLRREVLALTSEKPLFGQQSGKNGMTHWLVFQK